MEKDENEVPIQLALIDEINPFSVKDTSGVSATYTSEELKLEPVSLCLFPEYYEVKDD